METSEIFIIVFLVIIGILAAISLAAYMRRPKEETISTNGEGLRNMEYGINGVTEQVDQGDRVKYYLEIVSETDMRLLPEFVYPCKAKKIQQLRVDGVNYAADSEGIHLAVFKDKKRVFSKGYNTHHPLSGSVDSFYKMIFKLINSDPKDYDLFIIQTKNGVGDLSSVLNQLKNLKAFDKIPMPITDQDVFKPYIWIYDNKHKRIFFEDVASTDIYLEYNSKVYV